MVRPDRLLGFSGKTVEIYKVLPLDQLTKVQLSEVLDQWTCRVEDTNRITIAVSARGLTPSVQNWIRLFNAPTPEFSWLNLSGARKAGVFNIVKLGILDFSSDRTFYVSEGGSRALLWNEETGAVYLFQDQRSVVRFALCSRTRKSIKTVQRTGASRFAQRRIQRHRRLASVADLCVSATSHYA